VGAALLLAQGNPQKNQNPTQGQNQNQNQANQAKAADDSGARRTGLGFQVSEKATQNQNQTQKGGNQGGNQGLEVTSVTDGSAAAHAGLRQNDRIISIDGYNVGGQRQLNAYLAGQSGRRVPVLVERNGQRMMLEFDVPQSTGDHAWLGVYLEEAETSDNVKGARITQIFPSGPASRAGLQVGDIITGINDQKITDSTDLVNHVQELKPQTQAQFAVTRNNQETKIPVTLGSRNDSFPRQNYQAGYRGGYEQGYQQQGYQPGPQRDDRGASFSHDPYSHIPPYAMQLESERRMGEQHERIENEIRALREEIAKLREELKKK